MDAAAAALNLSYVLHAPSTSAQVVDAVRLLQRGRPHLDQTVTELSQIPAGDVFARTVVLNMSPDARPAPHDGLISVRVGVWPVLAKVFQHISGADCEPQFVDGPCPAPDQTTTFFRAPAVLCPAEGEVEHWWFAGLVVRPGGRSLLLEMTALPDSSRGNREIPGSAIPLAESVIRSHVLQWDCERALWAQAAEEVLSEFKALRES